MLRRYAKLSVCQNGFAQIGRSGGWCVGSARSIFPRIIDSNAITEPRSSLFTTRATLSTCAKSMPRLCGDRTIARLRVCAWSSPRQLEESRQQNSTSRLQARSPL